MVTGLQEVELAARRGQERQAPKSNFYKVDLGPRFGPRFLIPDLKSSLRFFLHLWTQTPLRL